MKREDHPLMTSWLCRLQGISLEYWKKEKGNNLAQQQSNYL